MFKACIHVCLLVTLTLGILSCSSQTGKILYSQELIDTQGHRHVQRYQIQTPTPIESPATMKIDSDQSVLLSTGTVYKVLESSKGLARLPYLGAGLLLIGVLLSIAKLKLPFLPLELGIGVSLVGLALIVLPSIIEQYLGYILIGLIGTAALIFMYRFNATQFRLKQLDPDDPTPNT